MPASLTTADGRTFVLTPKVAAIAQRLAELQAKIEQIVVGNVRFDISGRKISGAYTISVAPVQFEVT